MRVDIYAEDWMLSMGMIGLKRLLEEDVELTDSGISFEMDILENVPERFFDYMLREYNVAQRDYERMNRDFNFGKRIERFKQSVNQISKAMSDQRGKIVRYFKGQPPEIALKELIKKIRNIKVFDQYGKLEEYIEEYYEIMKTKEINEKLTINYFKTVILQSFYGQPSFLNVSKNALTKKEQIELFFKDYVKPVILESKLHEFLQTEQKAERIKGFLEDNKDYPPFNGMYREIRKKHTMEEIKRYFNDIPQCALIDGQLATTNFEEMIFSPLGITGGNCNFNWNLEKKPPVPLSVMAKLILFLASVGVVFYNRKDGFGGQGQYRTYAGFVMSDERFPAIYRMNNSFKIMKKKDNPFDEIVFSLLQDVEQRAKYVINQLFFLEIHSDYRSKKTLLDYYHMPPYVAHYVKKYGDNLKNIYPRELREAFIRTILQGIEPRNIVFLCLRNEIKRGIGISSYIAARELNRIQRLKKGVRDRAMHKEDKRIYVVFKRGQDLREMLIKSGETRATGTEVYTASGGKKINGIAYRLLNSAKGGNKDGFMDTLLRIHMAANLEMSSIFLNVLHEKDLSFEVVSSAFIAGLLTDSYSEKEADDNG